MTSTLPFSPQVSTPRSKFGRSTMPKRPRPVIMSPKRRTQAERAMETQGKLIAAALGVLREKGYAGFRIADVPGAAGVSRGAQSHHFPTKLELLLATFEWLYEQITERSRARLAKLKPEDDVIQQMLDDAAEFFLDDDFSISLDLIVAADRDPALREGIQRTVERNRFVVEDMWLGVLVSRGLSRDDAEDILWLIFNSVRGLAVRSLWQKDKERFERVRNSTLEIARERYAKFKRAAKPSGRSLSVREGRGSLLTCGDVEENPGPEFMTEYKPTVRLATRDDVPRAVRTLAAAFADYPATRHTVDPDRHIERVTELQELFLTRVGLDIGKVWVADDGAAVAVWTTPESVEAGAVFAEIGPRMAELSGSRLAAQQQMEGLLAPHRPKEPAWFLATVGVSPDHQGKGLGSAVVLPGVEAAERAGVPAFLETSAPRNLPFYERLGFTVTADVEVPEGPRTWCMTRKPGA
nr:cumate repressor/P2A/PuroR fusion protein [Cloning vector PBTRE-IntB1-ArrayG]QBF54090.1 cumate repressor/T2A/PuroR fusion protein [Cloning vector PBQP-H2B-EGFP2x]QBF54092.1 cumate repressor/T2A/PuroR fusion protein [Cloning vector PBQP-IntB1-EGFP2x]